MPPLTIGLLLLAALLHAGWNTLLRAGRDRLWSITLMGVVGGAAGLLLAPALPLPAAGSWPCLAISSALQVAYSHLLVRAYRDGHLAQVYPVARGTAPLLVTLGAWLAAGEPPTAASLTGAALVSGGILTLSSGADRPDGRTLAASLATGAMIAAYMVVDGVGVRLSHAPIAYAAWLNILQGLGLLAAFVGVRRRLPAAPRGKDGLAAVAAALIGTLAYGIALWAMSGSPMSQVSALRETSILFAAIIGTLLLREPLTPRRIVGSLGVAGGAVWLATL